MVKVLFNHDFAVPAVPAPAQSLRKQLLSPEEQERADARAYVKKQRFEVGLVLVSPTIFQLIL